MRTNIEAVLTPIWLLALSILVTIYLAWGFYYFDVDWMHLLNYVVIGKSDLWHNFNVLMRYLTFPWVGRLAMPDFPSSESGLKHFHDVKWLFHLVQILVVLLAYPAVSFLWRNVKKGTFGLYRRPVSYTHLDVYKRQPISQRCQTTKIRRFVKYSC